MAIDYLQVDLSEVLAESERSELQFMKSRSDRASDDMFRLNGFESLL